MKPKELPFYDDISDSSGIPLSMDEKQTSPLKEGVSKLRIYIQETSKPLHSVWYSFYDKVGQVKIQYQKVYHRIYHPNMFYNYSVMGTVAGGSWILHPLVFPKSGRIRRFFTPMLMGTLTAAYLYPNKTRNIGRSTYESGIKKYEEVKDKLTRKV